MMLVLELEQDKYSNKVGFTNCEIVDDVFYHSRLTNKLRLVQSSRIRGKAGFKYWNGLYWIMRVWELNSMG